MTASKNKTKKLKPNPDSEMKNLLAEVHDKDKPEGMPPFLNEYDYDTLKKMYINGEDVSQYVDQRMVEAIERTQKARDDYRARTES